ncbi:MAG: hypothetical protein ABI824_10670 [Acidobacteriota bacterium]
MTKNFVAILAACLALVGGVVWYSVSANQGHLLTLKGTVLKVRTLSFEPKATIVIVDFRVTNPSSVPFSVQDVALEMDPKASDANPKGADGKTKPVLSRLLEKRELARLFEFEPKAGAKEHEAMGAGDSIGAGMTKEFMISARFELPQADVESRAGLRILVHEIDRMVAEFAEVQTEH